MTDHRITAARKRAVDNAERGNLLDILVKNAEDVEAHFGELAARLPYSATSTPVIVEGIAEVAREIATATWRRLNEEVPNYAFAERLGRQSRELGHPATSVLLYWQMLRRSIHLVLAERNYRTGEGDETVLRQMMLMNYTMDWGAEASLVGYVLAGDTAGGTREPAPPEST